MKGRRPHYQTITLILIIMTLIIYIILTSLVEVVFTTANQEDIPITSSWTNKVCFGDEYLDQRPALLSK